MNRGVPLAAPPPEAELDPSHLQTGSPGPAPASPRRRSWSLPKIPQRNARLLALALLLMWGGLALGGRGETVVVIAPMEMHGSLGLRGPDGAGVAREMVTRLEALTTELRSPGLELSLAGPSLDRSQGLDVAVRLLPASPGGRVRYVAASLSADWEDALPGFGEIVTRIKTLGWRLTGRRIMTVTGQVFAAEGRPTLQFDVNRRPFYHKAAFGRDWTRGLWEFNNLLLTETDPELAALNFIRLNYYGAAVEATLRLRAQSPGASAMLADALDELIRQEESGTWFHGDQAFVSFLDSSPDWLTNPWQRRILGATPEGRRRMQVHAFVQSVAAYRALTGGWLADASTHCEAALELQPTHPQALLLRIEIARQRNDHTTAARTATRAVGVVPRSQAAHLYLWLSFMLQTLNVELEADRAFEEARVLAPNDPFLWSNRAALRFIDGDLSSAWSDLERALGRRRIWRIAAMQNRGVMEQANDDALAAERNWLIVGGLAPHREALWIHRARLAFDQGRYQAAWLTLEQGMAVLPDSAELPLQAAYAHAAGGDFAACAALLTLAEGRHATQDRLHLYRGHIAMLAGEHQQAGEQYQLSEMLGEDSGTALYGTGQAAFNAGDWGAALTAFEAYCATYPDQTRARLFLYLTRMRLDSERAPDDLAEAAEGESRFWLRRLCRLYLEDRWEEDRTVEAMSEAELRRRRGTEGYHLGEWWLSRGEVAAARAAFAASIATGLTHHYEYQAAWNRSRGLGPGPVSASWYPDS